MWSFFLIPSQACKGCLRAIAPLMGSESVNKMFQKHLLEEGHLHFGEFMNDLSRLIVSVHFLCFYVILILSREGEKSGLTTEQLGCDKH